MRSTLAPWPVRAVTTTSLAIAGSGKDLLRPRLPAQKLLARRSSPARAWPRTWSRVVKGDGYIFSTRCHARRTSAISPITCSPTPLPSRPSRILLSKQFVTAMCRCSLLAVCTNTNCGSGTRWFLTARPFNFIRRSISYSIDPLRGLPFGPCAACDTKTNNLKRSK